MTWVFNQTRCLHPLPERPIQLPPSLSSRLPILSTLMPKPTAVPPLRQPDPAVFILYPSCRQQRQSVDGGSAQIDGCAFAAGQIHDCKKGHRFLRIPDVFGFEESWEDLAARPRRGRIIGGQHDLKRREEGFVVVVLVLPLICIRDLGETHGPRMVERDNVERVGKREIRPTKGRAIQILSVLVMRIYKRRLVYSHVAEMMAEASIHLRTTDTTDAVSSSHFHEPGSSIAPCHHPYQIHIARAHHSPSARVIVQLSIFSCAQCLTLRHQRL